MSDRSAHRKRTQDFAILNVLVNYTGQRLTGDLVDEIHNEMKHQMHTGGCSWAFKMPEGDERSQELKKVYDE